MLRREYQKSLEELRMDVQQMGELMLERLDQSLSALEHNDTEVTRSVIEGDDEIDSLCHSASERVVRDLIEREATAEDPWSVEQVLNDVSTALLTIRDLERVADHVVNIPARTLYLVENEPELIY